MKRNRPQSFYIFEFIVVLLCLVSALSAKQHGPTPATLTVHTGLANCRVELDRSVLGATDSSGSFKSDAVEPGDHYLHVGCPGKVDGAYFLSPRAGEQIPIDYAKNPPSPPADEEIATLAANKARLEELVQKAIQYRLHAQLDEAIAALREAMKLDPSNSDLHREMGITYLLAKEWARARVEMIEALRNDHTDADAHNGLGYALEKLGDLEGALAEYHAATLLEPDDASYRTHYFEAQIKLQERKEKEK